MAHGTYDEIMNMINHSDENETYSRMKAALSELLASTQTELDMEEEVFDLEAIGEDQELVTSPVTEPKGLFHARRRPDWSRSISTTSLMSPSSDAKYELTYRASIRSTISFTETENCEFGNVNVEDDTVSSFIDYWYGHYNGYIIRIISPVFICVLGVHLPCIRSSFEIIL